MFSWAAMAMYGTTTVYEILTYCVCFLLSAPRAAMMMPAVERAGAQAELGLTLYVGTRARARARARAYPRHCGPTIMASPDYT